ncbi:hypothetical protein [Streptomyces sp. NPDC002057]|uniref:hypothetical protein n=1 Tax=Streptomyces sp. NPDC002057 TaxID=3154664 RepID=UPI003327EB44
MTTWGLVLEATVGIGQRKHTEAQVLTQVEGTREAALAELEVRARRHEPEHPRSPKRRRLFRHADGFLLVVDGAVQSHAVRFSVVELVHDSDQPPSAGRPAPPVEPVALPSPTPDTVEHDEDGVPLKPAWLGRGDLSR